MLKKLKLSFIDYRTLIEKGREKREIRKHKQSKNKIDTIIVILIILNTKATS
jgi:hypothetical protein